MFYALYRTAFKRRLCSLSFFLFPRAPSSGKKYFEVSKKKYFEVSLSCMITAFAMTLDKFLNLSKPPKFFARRMGISHG